MIRNATCSPIAAETRFSSARREASTKAPAIAAAPRETAQRAVEMQVGGVEELEGGHQWSGLWSRLTGVRQEGERRCSEWNRQMDICAFRPEHNALVFDIPPQTVSEQSGSHPAHAEPRMTLQKLPRLKAGSLSASTSAFTLPKVVSGLCLMPLVEALDDVLLEVRRARMGVDHGFALGVAVFAIGRGPAHPSRRRR